MIRTGLCRFLRIYLNKKRDWFSGRMSPSQGLDTSSILVSRTFHFIDRCDIIEIYEKCNNLFDPVLPLLPYGQGVF